MVSPHAVARDIAEAGLMRMVRTVAVIPPCIALIQVLANSHDYRQPALAIAVWLAVLGAAAWLVPRMRAGGLSAVETAAAVAIAVAAVALVARARQAHATPGSVDLAILGTVWLLVLVVVSRPAGVWIPAALLVFAVHSALLIRAEGLNRLSLSELAAAGYITAAILIAFAALRPTLAVHASMAARRSSLASRAAAERAAAAAIATSGRAGSRCWKRRRFRCCAASRTGRWTPPPPTSGTVRPARGGPPALPDRPPDGRRRAGSRARAGAARRARARSAGGRPAHRRSGNPAAAACPHGPGNRGRGAQRTPPA